MSKNPLVNRFAWLKIPPLRMPARRSFQPMVMLMVILLFPAICFSQKITLEAKSMSLKEVFAEIKKQTNYDVIYNSKLVETSVKVSVSAKDQPLETFLKTVLTGQPVSFTIVGTTIVVRKEEKPATNTGDNNSSLIIDSRVEGLVKDEKTRGPLSGASIVIKRTGKGTQSDVTGNFTLKDVGERDTLVCSMIGYQTMVVPARKTEWPLVVIMKMAASELDVAVVQAYGVTSKRLATGNITRISGDEIRKNPVLNPLLALQGRVPGMVVTPSSGHASAPVKVEIRGRNSLNQNFSSEPLYVIDGIPITVLDLKGYNNNPNGLSKGYSQGGITMVTGGQSILFGLNPNDIESIEVLKDGDATAIFGSRGANGVLMITTKRARAGKTALTLGVNQGFTGVPRHIKMMNTQEYLAIRREALKNDGLIPGIDNAPDLVLWDTTRYTDWQKELFTTGRTSNVSAQLSGGDSRNTFGVSANYSTQKGMMHKSGKDEVLSMSMNLNHTSLNQKLSISMAASFASTFVDAINIGGQISLPPNAPAVLDSNGALNWAEWGGANGNLYPFASLRTPSINRTNVLTANLQINYELLKGLRFSTAVGYNNAQNENEYYMPIASMDPLAFAEGAAGFGSTKSNNWSIEPTLKFNRFIGKGTLEIMAGSSLRSATTSLVTSLGYGYTNDDLIKSIANAPYQQIVDNYGQNKFVSVFGRISYNWARKYMLNLNGRRDGSSRFAPGKQFGDFGSAGASWIVSEEKWVKSVLPSWFSFIKLRSSYGFTGNDQVGDYQYLSQWRASLDGTNPLYNYNGVRPFVPIHAVNQKYHWESNKKFEIGLSLSFLKERINLDVAVYRNIAEDQLIHQKTPVLSGFANVTANQKAKVENKGLEVALNARLVENKHFSWSADFNIGFNKNTLLAYPGLEFSPDATRYKIGRSTTSTNVLHYIGIDPLTGNYSYEDYNKDGKITTDFRYIGGTGVDDRYKTLDLNPLYTGGFNTNLSYKEFRLGFSFTFQKGLIPNPMLVNTPGSLANFYLTASEIHKYWRKPGDLAQYPRFTTNSSSTGLFRQSDGQYSNGQYLKLNNISFSYSLPENLIRKAALSNGSFSITASNIFTISNFEGIDPAVLNATAPPIPRIISANLSFTF